MPDSDYDTLLDATIAHLEDLKRRGERFVRVDPATLKDLIATPTKPSGVPVATASISLAPLSPSVVLPSPAVTTVRPAVAIRPPAITVPVRLNTPARVVTLAPDDKVAAMAELSERARACVQCSNLAASRKNVVFGVGDIHSSLMFVGEAPGAEEDLQGEPFVGEAGQLLTKIIQAMGLTRAQVYIANVLKCRPDTPGQGSGNRKPTHEEMATCLPYLKEQIRIMSPKVIVALGGTAMEGLFGKSPVFITKLRGQWQDLNGIPVMPTYHPAYVLRNQSMATKRETWTDMLAAMERLGMPIREKQRGFFLGTA